jgi:hypothetical protein
MKFAQISGFLPAASRALEDLLIKIPFTSERKAGDPAARSKVIIRRAAVRTAAVSGALSLPPGPLGFLTIVPDLVMVWRIQVQMIVDIAGAYDWQGPVPRRKIVFCLFRLGAGEAAKDFAVHAGESAIERRARKLLIQRGLEALGIRVTRDAAEHALARWIPVVGALGMAAFMYHETLRVGDTACGVFSREAAAREPPVIGKAHSKAGKERGADG